jgi:hypothetical protein
MVSVLSDREQPISEKFRLVAKAWVDAEAAAQLLEETKTASLSQRQLALGDMPVSRSEMIVKASPEWHEHLEKIVAARAAANMKKVQMEYLRIKERELDRADWAARSERKMGRSTT